MARSDSQINKPQPRHPKRAELLDVNINTGVNVDINTGMQSFFKVPQTFTKSNSKNAGKQIHFENVPCCLHGHLLPYTT